jgi:hypothetical protein
MTNLVQNLEQCWYISPPWGLRITPLLINLLERVYVKSAKAFGYCTGVEWSKQGWKYEIVTGRDNITVLGNELRSTSNLQPSSCSQICLEVDFQFAEELVLRQFERMPDRSSNHFCSIELLKKFSSPSGKTPYRYKRVHHHQN